MNYDIAIIGAGPSGCACALALYNSGLRVVIIDKDIFPRHKICGDAIPSLAFKAMDYINIEWGKKMRVFSKKSQIHSSKIFAPGGKSLTLNWVLDTYNSKRINFDDFLFNLVKSETNTIIFENRRLKQITKGIENVCCEFQDGFQLTASIVIGCDGANSIVRRNLCEPDTLDIRSSAAVRSYFSGVEGVKETVNEFHFFDDLKPGYFWIFPLDNGLVNVGFGISQNKDNKNPINLRDSLNKIITSYPSIAPRFKNAKLLDNIKGFGLPLWLRKKTISGERFMLCGDAASLIDPLQGHGIDKGMWSGIFAANQAKECIKSSNFTGKFMGQYDVNLCNKIGSELNRSVKILQLIIRFPFLLNAFIRFGQNQRLMGWLARKFKI